MQGSLSVGFRPGLILGKNEQSQATHRVLEGKNDQILLLFNFWLFWALWAFKNYFT